MYVCVHVYTSDRKDWKSLRNDCVRNARPEVVLENSGEVRSVERSKSIARSLGMWRAQRGERGPKGRAAGHIFLGVGRFGRVEGTSERASERQRARTEGREGIILREGH